MVPKNIKCKEQVFDVSFHPEHDVIAAGLIDGSVELWRHSRSAEEKSALQSSLRLHEASCRGLRFNSSGDRLFTVSADKSWRAVDVSGKEVVARRDAHTEAINRLFLIDEHLLATGDDSGVVRLWDARAPQTSTMSWDAHTDFVADFDFLADTRSLFSASGDATLCVYDIRNAKHFYKSDDQEAELHCVRAMRHGKKVVCGSQDGVLIVFQSGQWGDCSDRFPGHPETVDCMWKVDESTLVTGSSDGLIRVVSLFPNKVLGVVGDHKKFPVEQIQPNRDRSLLASLAHDEKIRFWDISMLQDDEDEEEDGEEEGEDDDDEGDGEEDARENEDEDAQDEEEAAAEGQEDDNLEDEEADEDEDESSSEGENDSSSGSGSDGSSDDDSDEDSDNESASDASDSEQKKKPVNEKPALGKANAKRGSEEKKKPALPPKKAKGNQSKESESDDSDSDDSDDSGPAQKRKKIPTAAEKFYADL